MIKAVVFDLDDTLYAEINYVKSGFRQVADYLYSIYKVDYYDQLFALFEQDRVNVFNRLIANNGLKINIDILLDLYRNNSPKISFYDDVLPFLQLLKCKNIKLGIITDGRVEGQKAKLHALNCYQLFDKIIITDELGGVQYRKPNALSYQEMAKELQVDYENMIYIGDNVNKDFEVSKILPIKTALIKRKGYTIYAEEKKKVFTNYVVESLNELQEVFI